MNRTMILTILTSALLSIPLVADDAPAPLLFIERIEVRNAKRVSPDVVIAESRLREGHEYSEAELRDASTRLSRLPFLLSVDFALEKGSDRGRHVLVLTINETKPFFFLIDGQPTYNETNSYVRVESPTGGTTRESMAFGYRRFIGRRGALHIGFSSRESESDLARDYAAFSIGYTQYDLFGTRAFATLNLKKPIEGYGEGGISPQLVVGVPLSANQTLTLQFDETRTAPHDRTILGQTIHSQFGQRLITAKWSYNTTNEPFFPTRGTLLYVTPAAGWTDGAGALSITSNGDVFTAATHSDTYGAEFGATQYWELNDRDSVWGNVRGEWAHIDQRDSDDDRFDLDSGPITVNYGSLGVGYSRSLWSRERRANGGDSRVEATLRYSSRSRRYPYFGLAPENETKQIGAAWIRRTSWGTARLGLGYAF